MAKSSTTWQKGQSGNLAGKPRGIGVKTWRGLVSDCQRKYGDLLTWQHPDASVEIADIHEMAFVQLVSAVQNGEPWAVQAALDRGYGKPQQSVTLDADIDMSSVPLDQLTDDLLATIIAAGTATGTGSSGTAEAPPRSRRPA